MARWDFEKMATGKPIKMTGTANKKKVANIPANVRAKQIAFRLIPKAFDAMNLCISCRLLRDSQISSTSTGYKDAGCRDKPCPCKMRLS